MELRHIRYFAAICEARSFSRAAEALHVTQSTLSHQIQQLEDELGSPMLHRLGRRTEPTAAGELFLAHCEDVLRSVRAGVAAVHELEGQVRGILCVAAFHSFVNSRLPSVFADYASRYPGVHVVARQISRDEMERDLLGGALDFAVGYTEQNDPQIEAQPLFEESLVLVVGADHPWAALKSVPMTRLAELALVLLTPEFGARGYLDRYFSNLHIQPHVVLEMNAIEPILGIVRDTALASVLPEGAVGRIKQVRKIQLTDPVPKRQAAILWRALGHRSTAARHLAAMILAAYAPAAQGAVTKPA